MGLSAERILSRLDEHLHKNDYASAERHLLYWLSEARAEDDKRATLTIANELMGLYRKLGERENALEFVSLALSIIDELNIDTLVSTGTIFVNCATVYKAFGMPEKSLPIFERARAIYERELDKNSSLFGGLYNNMALCLVDLGRFSEAYELYDKAIAVTGKNKKYLETAITYLNVASAKEAEHGIEKADAEIENCLSLAKELLDLNKATDGNYAFVCEKCASVFGYYGHFSYENELKERARRIYEGA
jgi:tetratricopeptide (TPR) repeat protein